MSPKTDDDLGSDHREAAPPPPAFMQAGNLYVVPVLRHRLAFAALVRRALHQLSQEREWDPDRDLIAVTLPPSIGPTLRNAIAHLPRVSLILATVHDGGASREVVPVVPSDPMVEAVRTADERGWPVEFLDTEVLPGNLLRGPCFRDPDWPDEALVRMLGAEGYLSMIEGYYAQPPARLEPLDTWREMMIGERLRRLLPFRQRVLLVCDAGLVRSVINRLKGYAELFRPNDSLDPKLFQYNTVRNIKLDVLLYYLGDYPRLVERYNRVRPAAGDGRSPDDPGRFGLSDNFDESAELRSLVLECADRARDLSISTRQHQAFAQYLDNLLRSQRRLCPRPNTLYAAAAGCLGIGFAERLHCFLTGYESYIKVERVERLPKSRETELTVQMELDATSQGYWPRTCSPHRTSFYSVVLPQTDPKQKDQSFYRWLPEERFLNTMYAKVRQSVVARRSEPRVLEYRGSIEMGLDIRRTLRASRDGIPRIYVKGLSRRTTPVSTANEPHVWVIEEDIDGTPQFNASSIGLSKRSKINFVSGSFYVGYISVYVHPNSWESVFRPIDPGGNRSLKYARRCGWINFAYDFADEAVARAAYGDDFDRRVPNHGNFSHPCGCVDQEFEELAKGGAPWTSIALLTAAKYAKAAVVIVASPKFVVPPSVLNHKHSVGKQFVFSSLNDFSRAEREKLLTNYLYSTDGQEDEDAESMFRIVMRRYWD